MNKTQQAIQQSIQENRIIRLQEALQEVLRVAAIEGYHVDYNDTGEGITDVYGWTTTTQENEQDWRLYVIPIDGALTQGEQYDTAGIEPTFL